MIINALLLLLPVVAASGWYAAKRHTLETSLNENDKLTRSYLVGLNYLLNEQPDKAVDVFIKMVEIDSETVETHLALGTLFRRRGEVERAIRIHQNLIARPQLSKKQRLDALFALAQDYLRVGFLDRAERLFLEVLEFEGEHATQAKCHLLDLYQQEKRWEAAIETANKLVSVHGVISHRIPHYYCELAEEAIKKENMESAMKLLKQALSVEPHNARATILCGHIAEKQGDFKQALHFYRQIMMNAPDHMNDILFRFIKCYQALNDENTLQEELFSCLEKHPRTPLILTLSEFMMQQQGERAAIEFVAEQLKRRPSLRGLRGLVALQLKIAESKAKENLLLLSEHIDHLLKNKMTYRCMQCGYAGNLLHWLCPGCKNWETIKPILGVEGD